MADIKQHLSSRALASGTRISRPQWLAHKSGLTGCVAWLQAVNKRGQVCPATRKRGILTIRMWTGDSRIILDGRLDATMGQGHVWKTETTLSMSNKGNWFTRESWKANRGVWGNLEIRLHRKFDPSWDWRSKKNECVTKAQRLGLACGTQNQSKAAQWSRTKKWAKHSRAVIQNEWEREISPSPTYMSAYRCQIFQPTRWQGNLECSLGYGEGQGMLASRWWRLRL